MLKIFNHLWRRMVAAVLLSLVMWAAKRIVKRLLGKSSKSLAG
jgi:hypothetical protein